jgi:hypothetical protein
MVATVATACSATASIPDPAPLHKRFARSSSSSSSAAAAAAARAAAA